MLIYKNQVKFAVSLGAAGFIVWLDLVSFPCAPHMRRRLRFLHSKRPPTCERHQHSHILHRDYLAGGKRQSQCLIVHTIRQEGETPCNCLRTATKMPEDFLELYRFHTA